MNVIGLILVFCNNAVSKAVSKAKEYTDNQFAKQYAIVPISQDAYDLAVKDPNTLYLITEEV